MTVEWMTCNTCKAVVQVNSTGICLACQRGFTGIPAEDAYGYFIKSKDIRVECEKGKLSVVDITEFQLPKEARRQMQDIYDEAYMEWQQKPVKEERIPCDIALPEKEVSEDANEEPKEEYKIKFTYGLDPTKNILLDGKPISEYQKEESENADEKPSPKKMDARKEARNGKKVGKRNAKRKKTPKKGKKKEVKNGISGI